MIFEFLFKVSMYFVFVVADFFFLFIFQLLNTLHSSKEIIVDVIVFVDVMVVADDATNL